MIRFMITVLLCLQTRNISAQDPALTPAGNQIVNEVVSRVTDNTDVTPQDLAAITTKANEMTNEALIAGTETALALEAGSEAVKTEVEKTTANQIITNILTKTNIGNMINEAVAKDPTPMPSKSPTAFPTKYPTAFLTKSPTASPTNSHTAFPTKYPTLSPTMYPTKKPQVSFVENVQNVVSNIMNKFGGEGEGGGGGGGN